MPNLLVTLPSQLPIMPNRITDSFRLSVRYILMHPINQALRILALQTEKKRQQVVGRSRLLLIVNMAFDYCRTISMFRLFLGQHDTIIFIFGQQSYLFFKVAWYIYLFDLYMDNFGETQGNIRVIVYVCIYEVAWFILKINYGATRRESDLKIFKRLGVPPISYYLMKPLLLLFIPN